MGRTVALAGRVVAITIALMVGDTRDDARTAQIAALRRLGAEGRLRLAAEMSEDARQIAIESERRRHPEMTAHDARLAVLRRLWGSDLAARVPVSSPR